MFSFSLKIDISSAWYKPAAYFSVPSRSRVGKLWFMGPVWPTSYFLKDWLCIFKGSLKTNKEECAKETTCGPQGLTTWLFTERTLPASDGPALSQGGWFPLQGSSGESALEDGLSPLDWRRAELVRMLWAETGPSALFSALTSASGAGMWRNWLKCENTSQC